MEEPALDQHLELRERLHRAENQLKDFERPRLSAYIPTSPHYRAQYNGRLINDGVETSNLRKQICFLRDEVSRGETEIAQFIGAIDDEHARMLLQLRFLRGLTWEEVAMAVGGAHNAESVRTICRRIIKQHIT